MTIKLQVPDDLRRLLGAVNAYYDPVENKIVLASTDNPLPIQLVGSDIQIGAVEVKDGETDNRLQVDEKGRLSAVIRDVNGNEVQIATNVKLDELLEELITINMSQGNNIIITDKIADVSYNNVVIDNFDNIFDGNINTYGYAHDFSSGNVINVELKVPQRIEKISLVIKINGSFVGGKILLNVVDTQSAITTVYDTISSGVITTIEFRPVVEREVKRISIYVDTNNVDVSFEGIEIYGIVITKDASKHILNSSGEIINPATEDTLLKMLNIQYSGAILNGDMVEEITGIYATIHDPEKAYDETLNTYAYVLDSEITYDELFGIAIKLSKTYRANSIILVVWAQPISSLGGAKRIKMILSRTGVLPTGEVYSVEGYYQYDISNGYTYVIFDTPSNVEFDTITFEFDRGDNTTEYRIYGIILSNGSNVSIMNQEGAIINPATEDTLTLVKDGIDTLNGKDFATETTLSSIDGKMTKCDTDNVIAKLKDSSGSIINPATDDGLQYISSQLDDIQGVIEYNGKYQSYVGKIRRRFEFPQYRVINSGINGVISAGGEIDVIYAKSQGSKTIPIYDIPSSSVLRLQSNDYFTDTQHYISQSTPFKMVATNLPSGDTFEFGYKGDVWVNLPTGTASVFEKGDRIIITQVGNPIRTEAYIIYVDTVNDQIRISTPLLSDYVASYGSDVGIIESFIGRGIRSASDPSKVYHVGDQNYYPDLIDTTNYAMCNLYVYEDTTGETTGDHTLLAERLIMTRLQLEAYASGVNNAVVRYAMYSKDLDNRWGESCKLKVMNEQMNFSPPMWIIMNGSSGDYVRVYVIDENSLGPEISGFIELIQEVIE